MGDHEDRVEALRKSLNRDAIQTRHTPLPENAFFQVLHEPISAVFVDLTDHSLDGVEILSTFESLDRDLEIVLIGEKTDLIRLPNEILRGCFGHISPEIQTPFNMMVLHQLTTKISLKARLEKLQNTSIVDGLTQLYNHAYIQERMTEEIEALKRTNEPLSFVIFDIDNFKNYNDTNGHPAGDRVLKKVAELLSNSTRGFDVTGRYGGEEFVLILPGTRLIPALKITERFRKKIAEAEFEFGHKQPMGFVSASFGVAELDHKEIKDKRNLIDLADQALYRAKRGKRNCIWYYMHKDFHRYQAAAASKA
jgi:diguanylate cyclase (GGDEF)-like protein